MKESEATKGTQLRALAASWQLGVSFKTALAKFDSQANDEWDALAWDIQVLLSNAISRRRTSYQESAESKLIDALLDAKTPSERIAVALNFALGASSMLRRYRSLVSSFGPCTSSDCKEEPCDSCEAIETAAYDIKLVAEAIHSAGVSLTPFHYLNSGIDFPGVIEP